MKARKSITRFTIVMALAVLAVGVFAGAAIAVDNSTATLTGGSLSVTTPLAGSFTGTLDGAADVLSGSTFNGFTVVDPTGTGHGWSVTVKATQFDNTTELGHDLILDSLTMPALGVAIGEAGSSPVPGTLHSAATIDNATGVVMAACVAPTWNEDPALMPMQGMGTYTFTSTASAWKLAITADEYAGTYNSTITTTIAPLNLHAPTGP